MRMIGSAIALLLAATLGVVGCTEPAAPAEDIGNVAILVIDNFQEVPARPTEFSPAANCPYSPEDVNVVGDQGAGDDLPDGESHGKAVYNLLEQQLNTTAGLTTATARPRADYGLDSAAGITRLSEWSYRDSVVLLVGMDHDRSTTGDIADRLRDTVGAMRASKVKFSRFVLNMSFVIAPCNVAQWLKEMGRFSVAEILANYQALIDAHPGLRRFQSALDDLVRDADGREERILRADPADGLEPIRRRAAVSEFYGQIIKQNEGQVRERTFNDPLKLIIEGEFGVKELRVIPVAAAGNGVLVRDDTGSLPRRVRFAFPFAPAVWNAVLSVSASQKAQGSRAFYSNSGEVVMDGSWAVGSAGMQGTSFAAPRLSARHAVYLLTGGEATCQGHLPALGYTDSGRTGQVWNDLQLPDAAAAHCTDFMRRVIPASPRPGPTT
ncbi:S8 family serine peptidase [Allorhizocola rhizosphaerae]|uniref:S8 family serine peptidase n=1 Tax=Allorhizocola rhizosphaerae TaxID=1872709 RepID=UPI000E3D4B10|nr:S8 family serine peptidase [Allorhizocola rhizosphaerae]